MKQAVELRRVWPLASQGWSLLDMQQAVREVIPHRARVDGCVLGLRHPTEGYLVWKNWRLQPSLPEAASRMQLARHHTHRHTHLQGGIGWPPYYPRAFAKRYAAGATKKTPCR